MAGSIMVKEINLIILNSNFSRNQAAKSSGGVLYLSCSIAKDEGCQYLIENNIFSSNKANLNGGAIYYDLYCPTHLLENQFANNSAQYGQNFASYPFYLQLIQDQNHRFIQDPNDKQLIMEVASGQALNTKMHYKAKSEQYQDALILKVACNKYLFNYLFRGGMHQTCLSGYEGKLCQSCSPNINGKKYARVGQNQCYECEDLSIQIMKMLGILALIGLYVVYLSHSILSKPNRNKPQTVMIRILTNYFHAILIVKEFEMNWPELVENALRSFSFLSSQQQNLFSFDCFFSKQTFASTPMYIIKVIIFGLLPLILSMFGAIFWIVLQAIKKQYGQKMNIQQNILVSSFIFAYLCYPLITNQTFSLFSCSTLDNKQFLKQDLSIECWVGDHLNIAVYIGISLIGIWTIGFPLIHYYLPYIDPRLNDIEKLSVYSAVSY
ncbi:UNKNOWN [Stylonychia lemnae]|uniref:Transmembrane protein n=1 Tax=Stylonychia lemnae TaxID=5949 RepID=A0A078B6T9_STYLE|nr:UNKNOWN [Stylonychia lemnae]|eukprot:CDW90255.1 UNKNOWN [Stylonychia lemnae]